MRTISFTNILFTKIILSTCLCQQPLTFTQCTSGDLQSKRFSSERKLTKGYTQGQMTLVKNSASHLVYFCFCSLLQHMVFLENQKRIIAKDNQKKIMEIQGEKDNRRRVEGCSYQKEPGKHRNIERTCRFWSNRILRPCTRDSGIVFHRLPGNCIFLVHFITVQMLFLPRVR